MDTPPTTFDFINVDFVKLFTVFFKHPNSEMLCDIAFRPIAATARRVFAEKVVDHFQTCVDFVFMLHLLFLQFFDFRRECYRVRSRGKHHIDPNRAHSQDSCLASAKRFFAVGTSFELDPGAVAVITRFFAGRAPCDGDRIADLPAVF